MRSQKSPHLHRIEQPLTPVQPQKLAVRQALPFSQPYVDGREASFSPALVGLLLQRLAVCFGVVVRRLREATRS